MSEKSLSKNTRKNVILLHIAVMCFSFVCRRVAVGSENNVARFYVTCLCH